MEVQRWTKADDPETRCEFELSNGSQCGNRRVEGVTRCPLHGANKQLQKAENASMRVYNLSKFKARVGQLTDHQKLKSLNEEIALLRMMLETRWNACDEAHDLVINSGPIADLIMKIEKVVSSCNRLEGQLGNLLDKAAVKNLAATLMQIIADKINEFGDAHEIDPEAVGLLLDAIASAFLEQIQ
jgi:hypothetical protein